MVRMRMPEGSSFARSRDIWTSTALWEMCSSHDTTAFAILSLPTIASTFEKRYSRMASSRCERSRLFPEIVARLRSARDGPAANVAATSQKRLLER